MGILNVTPDSFSDGGLWNDPQRAREHASEMISQGADIIDIGAESTRPGADSVSEEDELSRLVPVLKALEGNVSIPLSVDTMKAGVARKAVEAGVAVINDVSGLADPEMASVAAETGVPIVLMSNYGNPKTFRTVFIEGDAIQFAKRYLSERIETARDAGVPDYNIIVDPGIGFGTTSEQSAEIVENSGEFGFGRYPVLIGPSRKRFLADRYPGMERDEATAEACVTAFGSGADILRVHNVACVARRFR